MASQATAMTMGTLCLPLSLHHTMGPARQMGAQVAHRRTRGLPQALLPLQVRSCRPSSLSCDVMATQSVHLPHDKALLSRTLVLGEKVALELRVVLDGTLLAS